MSKSNKKNGKRTWGARILHLLVDIVCGVLAAGIVFGSAYVGKQYVYPFVQRYLEAGGFLEMLFPVAQAAHGSEDVLMIPSLIGLSEEEAKGKAVAMQLGVKYAGEEASNEKAGTIIAQDPLPGSVTNEHETIKYTVSAGPESSVIPEVIGMRLCDGIATLEKHKYTNYKVEYHPTFGAGFGNIIGMSPSAGAKRNTGTVVTLTVNAGAANIRKAAGNYVGMTEDEAVTACLKDGLIPVIGHGRSSLVKKGLVMKQSISRRKQVYSGTPIVLTMNIGGIPDSPKYGTFTEKLLPPVSLLGGKGRFTFEQPVENDGTVIETVLKEVDKTPKFPVQLDIPNYSGSRNGIIRYYEVNESGAYVPRAYWRTGTVE